MLKLMSKKSSLYKAALRVQLVIQKDVIAQAMKKAARKTTFANVIHKELFGKEEEKKQVKAILMGAYKNNMNTRSLAMSQREFFIANKEQEAWIAQLEASLECKNSEEFDEIGLDSPYNGSFNDRVKFSYHEVVPKYDGCLSFSGGSATASSTRISDETKGRYGISL